VPPATMNWLVVVVVMSPENPDNRPPAFTWIQVPPVQVLVNVPVPLKVPFRVTAEETVGLAPKGREQLLFTVFVVLLLERFTKLKVTLLQLNVAVLPSNVIVPPFALKVGEPETVSDPARVIVPLGALKVPAEIVRAPFISVVAQLVKVNVPPSTVTVPVVVNVPLAEQVKVPAVKFEVELIVRGLLRVTVPEYPEERTT
jgi:hypothetical protein